MTSFQAVLIEGVEVVFIVIAVGATGNMLLPAGLGALAAGLLVVLLGLVLHKPLARVPENTLKFSVGVLLSAFGVFWIGEGLHFQWIGHDWAIIGLIIGFLTIALAATNSIRVHSTLMGTGGEVVNAQHSRVRFPSGAPISQPIPQEVRNERRTQSSLIRKSGL